MRDIVGDRDIDPEDYLLIWLGLVGNCVNLSVPSRLLAGSDASFLHK
jgi:ubiquitin-like-conjugating enzyme ATG10